jgi:hypothetical protein
MAAASYTTDLVDLDLAQSVTNWTNVGTGALASETDFYVQNGNCVSKPGWTGDATRGAIFNSGSGKTISTPNAYFAWAYFWGPGALETEANGGLQLIIGNSTTAYKQWYVRGADTISPFDGWACIPVDPSLTQDATTGSPTSTLQYFGVLARIKTGAAIGKGNPLGVDAIRYGRGELRMNGGDLANGYATFASLESTANSTTNRWGLFQLVGGSYQWQGLMTLGYTSAVDFRDSNRNIVIANTKKVTSAFNKIEVRQASSYVQWNNISITALGTTSRGNFECIDNADVELNSCTFTDMGTFIFQSAASADKTIWRRCNLVTVGGGPFTGCTFDKTNDSTKAVTASSPANAALISGSTFISSGTKYGLEITGTAANITLTNNTWTGYAASDGSTGNEAIFVNIATGSMNITISGGNTPSIRTAGCAVTVISGAVSSNVKVTDTDGVAIQNARVHVKAAAGGPMPSNVTVTISNSSTTATVTHTAHGMATNDKVVIKGASHAANNGVFTITKINNDSYSYTMTSAPGSSPTGTIKSTYVLHDDVTDANGNVPTVSRVFGSSQPITGWARKSSSAPYYKSAGIAGTVSSSLGFSSTVQLIADQ